MRILLADDAALLREALQALLERLGHEVVATAGDATELVAVYRALETAPDLVVTDVRMPPTRTDDGLRAALEIRELAPEQPVLALSQYVADRYARDLLTLPSGGVGYLLKERVNRVTDFDQALATVAAGGTIIDPEVTRHLLRQDQPGPLADLTPREREVLELMAKGESNAGIAAQLYVSDAAVRKHIGNIFTRLGLQPSDENRRVRAILTYLQAG
ncbi:Transcriptional regulatory protein DegU [Leucobacter aridicollis]|uniref:response regulator n=1 Tax=Leucobacter aridicollis TaxID=283878 RepID=UPI000EB2D4F7|nr:response regulator transcription factor [Leucobacter aridicollis]MCS3427551.1 DNA-binding NarL/FixJ family response regulator [Leucobacter aridicollis]RKQ84299.1 LuxR family two component transcriptional regulator [Mycolicibacterium mucogenicum 261Sha1.1M5]